MIVTDTNVLIYLTIPGEFTPSADAAHAADSVWAAPLLWSNEFRNVLGGHIRRGAISREDALLAYTDARASLSGGEHAVDTELVIDLVQHSRCSAFDCGFVALALTLDVALVTSDRLILTEFPDTAVPLNSYS